MKNTFGKAFLNGLMNENPLLILMIGLCSALAVTTSVVNGLGMGLGMTFVLVCSEVVISIFKKVIPDSVRIPIFIIVIAAFTTIVQLVMQAYTPGLSAALGVFIPLIVVNCIIMGRVEAFAYKQPLGLSFADSLGMGLGYTWVLIAISIVREILGAGTLLSGLSTLLSGFGIIIPDVTIQIPFLNDNPILFFTLAPGGFVVFGLYVSLGLFIKARKGAKVQREKVGCC
jgi:electron transport complex protein RnfE